MMKKLTLNVNEEDIEDSQEIEQSTGENEEARILLLAERLKMLFGFCADLIPDLDLLERTEAGASERASMAMSAAPILGAMGKDYEEVNFEWEFKSRRAKAIINLLKVLKDTEDERLQRKIKARENAEAGRNFMQFFQV